MGKEYEPIRILHVDDDPGFTDLVAEFLEHEDDQLTVTTETTANDGLDRLADSNIDCVVSDYEMPGRNGIEFLETVRDRWPDLPFILFTGKGSEAVASDAISAGVTDYLQKETGTDQYAILANRIRNAVERTRAQRDRQRHLDAIETAQDGISILDEDGRFVYVNDAYADLYGYDSEELLGEHWERLYRDEDVDTISDKVLPMVEEQGHWHGTTKGLRADGSTFVEDHNLATTANGELVCTVRDVTERTKRQQSIEHLHDTAQHLMKAKTTEEVAEIAVEAVQDILGMPSNAVHLYDEGTEQLSPVASSDVAEKRLDGVPSLGPESLAWEVFQTGTPQIHDDVSTVSGRRNPDTDIRSEIILPLNDYGVFLISSAEEGAFDATEVSLAQTVAAHTAAALTRVDREQALRAERAFINQALDALDDLYYVLSLDGELQRWNDRLREVSGYTDEELSGKAVTEFFPDDEHDRITDGIEEALSTGSVTVEADILTKSGDRIPYELTGARLIDTDGELAGLVGVGRDISGRRKQERQLKELHAFATDLLACETRKEVCERTVKTAENVLEFDLSVIDLEEDGMLPTVAVSDGMPPGGNTTMSAEEGLVGKTYRTGESYCIDDVREWEEAKPQGSHRSVLSIPIGDHGVFQAGSERLNAFDDSDLELAELLAHHTAHVLRRLDREQELERKNEQLEEFTSIISHDLRNPLNVAQGHLEMARQNHESDRLASVSDAHDRMTELIEDLLALARTDNAHIEVTTVDLNAVADRCWENVDTADATLTVETDRMIQADSSRFRQLLENLFRNAVEHGGDAVSITVSELSDANGFYVADNGIGIPEVDRSRVFESGYSTTDQGTGIGLSIVEQVANAHGWDIEVTASDEGGARFEFHNIQFDDG